MAQPQGLNVPVILVTAIITVILTGSIIEGVRAYYHYTEAKVEAQKWDSITATTVTVLKHQQKAALESPETTVPIESAMSEVVRSGGKLPTTRPGQM